MLWESGSVTLQDLSDRFGISRVSLSEGLKKRKSVKGSRAGEFAKTAEDALKSETARKMEDIKNFRKEYHTYGNFLMKMTIKELNELLAEKPRTLETKRRIFTALKVATDIYAKVRDQKFHLYDLYNEREEDEVIPEIAVVQYSQEELEKIRSSREPVLLLDEDEDILAEARAALETMDAEG